MSPESGAEQNWSYLKGKKIVESRDAVGDNIFLKSDLPKGTRVLKPDDMMTMDFRSDRLNVHVNEQNVVQNTRMG